MRALGRFALVVRAASQRVVDPDLLDDENFVLEIDLAFGL
jgi:hypothetical protein